MLRIHTQPQLSRLGTALLLSFFFVFAQPTAADILTVGPTGEFGELDTALEAAELRPGDHEIKLQAGVYRTNTIQLSSTAFGSRKLSIQGGFQSDFRRSAQALTVLESDGSSLVIDADLGEFRLTRLSLQSLGGSPEVAKIDLSGNAVAVLLDVSISGGGLETTKGLAGHVTDLARLRLINVIFQDLELRGAAAIEGALAIDAEGQSEFFFNSGDVLGTLAKPSDRSQTIAAAGASLRCRDSSRVTIQRVDWRSNRVDTDGGVDAAHLRLEAEEACEVTIHENNFVQSQMADSVSSPGPRAGAVAFYTSRSEGSILIDRARFDRNGGDQAQVWIDAPTSSSGTFHLRNSSITGGSAGLRLEGGGPAPLILSNLSILGHDGLGIDNRAQSATLYNSVVWASGLQLPPGQEINYLGDLEIIASTVGVDPVFTASPNFTGAEPRPGVSPGIDQGTQNVPGGVGSRDLLGRFRVVGRKVDLGAKEAAFVDARYPDYAFRIAIANQEGVVSANPEQNCIADAVCVSGALDGRTEAVLRIIGPRPNGRLWPQVVRFTPAALEIRIQQLSTGEGRNYQLGALAPSATDLPGIYDRFGFPAPQNSSPASLIAPPAILGRPSEDLLAARRGPTLGFEEGSFDDLEPIEPSLSRRLSGPSLTDPAFPDFRFRVRITNDQGTFEGRAVRPCLSETVCVSGALADRTEVFLRLIGPRPSGFLWVQLNRFTPSEVEVEIEQISTGVRRSYLLAPVGPSGGPLTGKIDREAFLP